MTATVRKTDEELTDKRKCKIGGLMTDLGLLVLVGLSRFCIKPSCRVVLIAFKPFVLVVVKGFFVMCGDYVVTFLFL